MQKTDVGEATLLQLTEGEPNRLLLSRELDDLKQDD
jgi:hypothetical protein